MSEVTYTGDSIWQLETLFLNNPLFMVILSYKWFTLFVSVTFFSVTKV